MSRRLPIYLVLDTSGSMGGEPITAVNTGLQTMQSALRRNPQANESAYVSVITFGKTVQEIIPLTEVQQFVPPVLQASGATPFGEALRMVKALAEKNVQKTVGEQKGDWKPMVFIMTDGSPTDDYNSGIAKFKEYKWGPVIACAAGPGADDTILKQVTENVYKLDTLTDSDIGALFKWLSASIGVVSASVETGGDVGSNVLPPPPIEIKLVT